MTLELVAIETCQLAHDSLSLVSGGTFTVLGVTSQKNRAEGGRIIHRVLRYTFAGGNSTGFDPGTIATTVTQRMDPTAAKVKSQGFSVLREGDLDSMTCTGTVTATGNPGTVIGLVVLDDAGQTTVKAQ